MEHFFSLYLNSFTAPHSVLVLQHAAESVTSTCTSLTCVPLVLSDNNIGGFKAVEISVLLRCYHYLRNFLYYKHDRNVVEYQGWHTQMVKDLDCYLWLGNICVGTAFDTLESTSVGWQQQWQKSTSTIYFYSTFNLLSISTTCNILEAKWTVVTC